MIAEEKQIAEIQDRWQGAKGTTVYDDIHLLIAALRESRAERDERNGMNDKELQELEEAYSKKEQSDIDVRALIAALRESRALIAEMLPCLEKEYERITEFTCDHDEYCTCRYESELSVLIENAKKALEKP